MVSRGSQVTLGFGILALIILVAVANFTNLPTWVSIAVVLVVGVLIPQVLNESSK